MSDSEIRALRRAAALLLLVSAARWSWGRAQGARASTEEPSVLDELAVAVDEAVEEEERRSRPLGEGERIDPNRADEVELDRLPGVGPAIAAAIVSARDDGLTFRRPEDLQAVRGIGPATVARLESLLDLRQPPPRAPSEPSEPARVDLNRADAADLERLPRIGPALAARIVQHRREHPFTTVDDLLRVRGIGPETLEGLRPLVTVR